MRVIVENEMHQMKKTGRESDFGIIEDPSRGITMGQLVESVAKMTGLRCTPAMIYNYERHGLIPEPARTVGGFRSFRRQDIQAVACIKRWQAEGKTLVEIKAKIGSLEQDFDFRGIEFFLPVDKQSQILEAAATIFPQKGYAATTLQDIAQEAGLSISAIYQFFSSKEELFLALTDNLSFIPILDQINDNLNEEKDIGYDDIRRSLIAVGEAFLDTHMRNAEIVRLFIAEARSFPEVGKRYCVRLIEPVEKQLMRYLSAHINRGNLRPVNVELAVHAFYGAFLNFVVTQNLLVGEGILHFPKKDRVSQLVDIFLIGVFNPSADSNNQS